MQKGDGQYAGFDESEYTSESGGKANAIRALKKENQYTSIAMVGDGATDAEARQPGCADIFIGYGGNVERLAVKERSDWFVYSFAEMKDVL